MTALEKAIEKKVDAAWDCWCVELIALGTATSSHMYAAFRRTILPALSHTDDASDSTDHTGLSARAYFAAHAPITVKDAFDYLRANEPEAVRDYTTLLRTLAQMRLAYADAMLEAGAA